MDKSSNDIANDASSVVSNNEAENKNEGENKSGGENACSDDGSNEGNEKNKRRQRRQRTHFSSMQLQELEALFARNRCARRRDNVEVREMR